ncbi:hypothetical protein HHL11_28920 [Ramlibacter sp. G-1-2-2]|uniref:Uncharacterized protein n=1 Tax=Ramlibacter agri TaxID=2728837 RepID=A0A848H9W7_9BURK|nr:hypothetical protein [Ramlibacter agri]NML47806.1 hypothetical protein [Ramlibacter agri]
MKMKHAAGALAIAAAFAAPAFADQAVVAASGPVVTSGTGVVVTPGAPLVAVQTVPVPGAVVAEIDSHTTVDGNRKTTVTRYWNNVPPDVKRDDDFRRWQMLK